MAKDKLTEYDATAANNTVVGDVNLAENSCLPSDLNNAVREVMSHLKGFASGTDAIDALTVTGAATVNGAFTSPGIDDNADATAITIDSSENVLVGTTTFNSNNVGVIAGASGAFFATRDGDTPAQFNRKTSDGNIVGFQKDGSTVGHLGTSGGHMYFGCDDVGLIFRTNESIRPYNPGSTSERDAAIDLGVSSQRFKDLYLSGTAYVDTAVEIHAGLPLKLQNVAGNGFATIQNAGAGTNTDLSFNTAGSERLRILSGGGLTFNGDTAAANALDDYEEGTFTPTAEGNTTAGTGTYLYQVGSYVKVGSLVQFQLNMQWSSHSGSGAVLVKGLPFTSKNTTNLFSVGSMYASGLPISSNHRAMPFMLPNRTYFNVNQENGSGGASSVNIDSAAQILLTGVYRTDA